jgi:hypothetical protein
MVVDSLFKEMQQSQLSPSGELCFDLAADPTALEESKPYELIFVS